MASTTPTSTATITYMNKHTNLIEAVVIDSGFKGPTIGIVGSVHGNEPAGSATLMSMLAADDFRPSLGKIIIITKANPVGLDLNIRENPITGNDINRQFGGDITDESARQILDAVGDSDVIIDLHEGWGWHLWPEYGPHGVSRFNSLFGPKSVGSTLTVSNHKIWNLLPDQIAGTLNQIIPDRRKWFSVIRNASCKIPTSLNCYAQKNDIPYMLVETSGQNDVQGLGIRVTQMKTIINMVLAGCGLQ
jgi:hypothetical protein